MLDAGTHPPDHPQAPLGRAVARRRLIGVPKHVRRSVRRTILPLPMAATALARAAIRDLELFDRWLAYAGQQEAELAIETLGGALELVEGPVFRLSLRRAPVLRVSRRLELTQHVGVQGCHTAEELAEGRVVIGDLDGRSWRHSVV